MAEKADLDPDPQRTYRSLNIRAMADSLPGTKGLDTEGEGRQFSRQEPAHRVGGLSEIMRSLSKYVPTTGLSSQSPQCWQVRTSFFPAGSPLSPRPSHLCGAQDSMVPSQDKRP